MSSNYSISVDNLSKCYPIYNRPSDRLKQFIVPKIKSAFGLNPTSYYREFWALKDVSFKVGKGETVGIIGRNGSGKSTLLQMICGTLNQTHGHITTEGRIGALLELGSGFNPEFTGRENVYMNAAVLGLTKDEIDAVFDDIVNFADIGEFIDQPVKTYSSGMMVRLAFAVQAQTSPQILIVDEALAVGDAKFQAKCFERLKKLKDNGTSILLVTHSSEQIVTHCSNAILLDRGQVLKMGAPKDVVNTYMDLLFGKRPDRKISNQDRESKVARTPGKLDLSGFELSSDKDVFSSRPGYNPHEYRWGDGAAKILDFHLSADGEAFPPLLRTGQEISLLVTIKFQRKIFRPIFGFTLKTKEGVTVYGANSETLNTMEIKDSGDIEETLIVRVNFECRLATGDYFISLGVASREGDDIVPHDRRYDSVHLQVQPNTAFFGLANLDLNFKVEDHSQVNLC